MSVVDQIWGVHESKTLNRAEVLRALSDRFMADAQRDGPTSELLDIFFAATRVQVAPIPGGEVQACGNVLRSVISYMRLRADMLIDRKNVDYEPSLMEALKDLITEAAKLYSEVNANLPTKTEK